MDSGRTLRIGCPAAGLPPGADIINGLGGERKVPPRKLSRTETGAWRGNKGDRPAHSGWRQATWHAGAHCADGRVIFYRDHWDSYGALASPCR